MAIRFTHPGPKDVGELGDGTLVDESSPVVVGTGFVRIVDRATARAEQAHLERDARTTVHVPPGSTCVIHVFGGALREASASETLVTSEDVELTPKEKTRVALAWAHARDIPRPDEGRPSSPAISSGS